MQKYKVYINNEPKIITDNWESFKADYILIEAAGGLVYNIKNQILMIFRNDKWDLPKGKLEVGENINECAIREVNEECGVDNLVIIKPLKDTYHTYEMNGVAILKRTYWFKMKTNFTADLIPQLKEGITKVEWVSKEGVSTRLENSYGNINEIFEDE